MTKSILLAALLCVLLVTPVSARGGLSLELRQLTAILTGEDQTFSLHLEVRRTDREGPPDAVIDLSRRGAEEFSLSVRVDEVEVDLDRVPGTTRLAVPRRDVVFVGTGEVPESESLRPLGIALRILSRDSSLRSWYASIGLLSAVGGGDAGFLERLVRGLVRLDAGDLEIEGVPGRVSLRIRTGETLISLDFGPPHRPGIPAGAVDSRREVVVDRAELERSIFRAARRAGEVLFPGRSLAKPRPRRELTDGGSLRFEGPLRLAVLSGTPEEIGAAHGRLLREEVRRCIDSTFHLAGLGYTIDKGEWFPDVLRAAFKRLAPHIPADHLTEMDALAAAAGIDRETMRLANVFPELFHCSGFAVFGKATKDGKLYHGRVLDYMTMIGLQDAATVFVVAPKGKHAFVNVGYAGFIGSVTGMNDAQVSLGEMGGRGEGNWDGVPMATLMRRGLEECGSLNEVIRLFETSPRTCEYYYVFADGKIPDAVGIAATPESLSVIRAGETHPRLGAGIEDTVVMSAGSRLRELRRRIIAGHGAIDAGAAIRLMDRPVAMKSNLHNALFVPQDLMLFVAHADHERPAAECAYTSIDFGAILERLREAR